MINKQILIGLHQSSMQHYIKFIPKSPNPLKKERNTALIQDRENGVSYRQLQHKYGISQQRCHEIYNLYKDILGKKGGK